MDAPGPPRITMSKHQTRGRDLAAPSRTLTLDGVAYQMVWSNLAARVAEDVYEDIYHKPDKGYYAILDEAGHGKHRALQALCYGAIVAGGAELSWEDYDRLFSLTAIGGIDAIIMDALGKSLPPEDDSAPNPGSQPEGTQDDGPGAG